MKDDLVTISHLFNEKLFRIPDYQRGFAWTVAQLDDYWGDILQIEETGNHYTGVVTLEAVPAEIYENWSDDLWIIKSKNYRPYYIVDGQQRLTTTLILIQCIVETLENDEDALNYTTKLEIQKRFLYESKLGGVSRSYIFGYEKDNPSYEFLKTRIFNENSVSDRQEETVYTNNLIRAKEYFSEKLNGLAKADIEKIYTKITQKLLFNIFSISEDVDVCVAFETMNNRGKPLSYLELLKNRLIYLSVKLNVDSFEAGSLRKTVNSSWKTIYHNLGRSKKILLDDDFFLRNHHFINYIEPVSSSEYDEDSIEKRNRMFRAVDAQVYRGLLNDIFTLSSITEGRKIEEGYDLKALQQIHDYSISLQSAVKEWYIIFNPSYTNDKENFHFWLAKIIKISSNKAFPILLSVMLSTKSNAERLSVFRELERLLFIERLISSYYNTDLIGNDLLSLAIRLHRKEITPEALAEQIRARSDAYVQSDIGRKQIREAMRSRNYYTWRGIQYFLYEYNLELQLSSKTERDKIEWDSFIEREHDFKSVEHIYPQKAQSGYWRTHFQGLRPNQRDLLKNVVGNLLPLSKPKNASLSNNAYPEKVSGKSTGVGYVYGSYAENEVADTYKDWNPSCILDRSLQLLDFLEFRWRISLGKDSEKIDLLGLGFVVPTSRKTPRRWNPTTSQAKTSPKKPQKKIIPRIVL